MGHVFDEQVREVVENLPLDDGVRSLLQGCLLLTRFSVYLRAGGLSDKGVGYIGEFGAKLKSVLLGYSGESDEGLRLMADGSRELERLELRGCPFGEAQIATSILTMWTRLKYLWVQGIGATANLGAALVSNKPGFLVEFMGETAQILGYYTLTQPRTDHPASVCLIYPEDKPREVNSQEMHEWTKCSGDA
jgi:coronatine-insensitive protein 1